MNTICISRGTDRTRFLSPGFNERPLDGVADYLPLDEWMQTNKRDDMTK